MEKSRNVHHDPEINNAAFGEASSRPNSVQGINRGGGHAVYMECRRNFLASIGGYIIDGCWKFSKGAVGSQDDVQTNDDFLCSACGCHRSFHRKAVLPPLPPHLPESTRRYIIMYYLRSLPLQLRPSTPWVMRQPELPNYELIESQGSSLSPGGGEGEGEEKSDSDSGDEINQPLKVNKEG